MFSLNWFTTVPGILITVGVLLLVVALIIFIVTSMKDKKKGKTPAEIKEADKNMASPQTLANSEVQQAQVNSATTPVTPAPVVNPTVTPNLVQQTPIQTEVSTEVVPQAPVMPEEPAPITTAVEVPTVGIMPQDASVAPQTSAPVAVTPEVPTIPVQPTIEQPATPEIPVTNVTIPDVPSVEQVVPEMQDTNPGTVTVNAEVPTIPITEPQIYGGATPNVTSVPETEHHEIYGGANPLESTQQIPISEITNNNINVNNENPAGLTSIDSVNQNNPQ